MSSIELDRPLDENEYDELGELLQSRAGEDGMLLDALHGMMTAIAIGPETVPPDEWMATVVNEADPFESVEQAERAIALILRFYNTVAGDLDRLRYEPILGQIETEDGEATLSAHGWCEGFSRGVDLRSDTWESRMQQDPRLMEIMGPIVQLAADEGVFESEEGEDTTPLSENEYEDALNALPGAVADVQQYWRDHPPSVAFAPPEDVAEQDVAAGEAPEAAREIPRTRGGRSVH